LIPPEEDASNKIEDNQTKSKTSEYNTLNQIEEMISKNPTSFKNIDSKNMFKDNGLNFEEIDSFAFGDSKLEKSILKIKLFNMIKSMMEYLIVGELVIII
jgi:hypothetical protein